MILKGSDYTENWFLFQATGFW